MRLCAAIIIIASGQAVAKQTGPNARDASTSNNECPVGYNQCDLERWFDARQTTLDWLVGPGCEASALGISEMPRPDGTRSVGDRAGSVLDIDLEDPRAVARTVVRWAPAHPIVFPTEHYFYFAFHSTKGLVRGNIRFVEAPQGRVSVGYYIDGDARRYWSAHLGCEDGVAVEPVTAGVYRLTIDDATRDFRVLDARELPVEPFALRPTERAITAVLDESGVMFRLVYDEHGAAFFFVYDDSVVVGDDFIPIAGHERTRVGRRSGFVLYTMPSGRRVLIGVDRAHITHNNEYDGPFDQVPPDLELKAMLERAYPYVTMRGGIDQHGVFVTLEDQRVAISPYQAYRSLDELARWADAQAAEVGHDEPALTRALTYERKRDFHRALGKATTLEPIATRLGWPANHRAVISASWPWAHRRTHSLTWPADHVGVQSSRDDSGRDEPGSFDTDR